MTASLLSALTDLVLPAVCAGCAVPGAVVCNRCASALHAPPRPAVPIPRPVGMPPCWAAAEYDGAVRAVLLEYKEHDRRAAVPVLARALARAVGAAAPRGPVVLVPVPSSPAAVRARGGDHVYRLARAASGDLRRSGWSPRVARLLGAARTRRDSAGLDAGERRANLAGAFRPRRGSERLAEALGGPFVLVDDLVTTGATLTEAARTLRTFCVDAVHAAVIAATVRRVSITACRASRHALTRTGGDETPPSG